MSKTYTKKALKNTAYWHTHRFKEMERHIFLTEDGEDNYKIYYFPIPIKDRLDF